MKKTKFRINAIMEGEFEDEEEGLTVNELHEAIEGELVVYFADIRSKLSQTPVDIKRVKSITIHKEEVT